MEVVCEEFFQLPAEDKAHLYSEDNKLNRLFSGSTFKTGNFWMDCLRLACTFPAGLTDSVNDWPEKPQRLRYGN
jgi:2'-deoxymugineic-acid 2'-dioxygenase / mugineic-acid 3-dioxygenase